MARTLVLVISLVVPGLAVACVCGCYALADWAQLREDYQHFQVIASTDAGLRAVFIAYAAQEVHRVNLFAEGVWALLGLLLAGLGIHGLCGRSVKGTPRREGPD